MKARTWLVGLSGTTLLATVGVVGLGTATVANATTPIEVAAGTVTISTGTTDSIVYDDGVAGTPNVNQALGTSGKCALSPASGSLVAWSSTSTANGAPGYYGDSIGVSSGNKTSGTACSQINQDAGESLALRFTGTALAGAFGATLRATSASLDLEVKSNALVVLQGLDAAGAPITGQVYKLYTGSSTAQNPHGPLASDSTNADRNCTAQSDSGPDSGANDNCRWIIDFTTPVSGIRITPSVGSADLEGGGDFGTLAGTNRTSFAMVDVADGEFCVGATQTATFSGTGDPLIDSSSVTRLPDTNGNTAGCIPYTLTVDGPSVSFRKPADTPLAQFLITVDRSITAPTNPVDALLIDWINPAEIDPIGWCPDAVYNPASTPSFNPAAATDMVPSTSTLEYTCLYSSVQTLQGDGSVNVTDRFYLVGDPKYGAF